MNKSDIKAVIHVACGCVVCSRGGFSAHTSAVPADARIRGHVRFAELVERHLRSTQFGNVNNVPADILSACRIIRHDCGATDAERAVVQKNVDEFHADISRRRTAEFHRLMG